MSTDCCFYEGIAKWWGKLVDKANSFEARPIAYKIWWAKMKESKKWTLFAKSVDTFRKIEKKTHNVETVGANKQKTQISRTLAPLRQPACRFSHIFFHTSFNYFLISLSTNPRQSRAHFTFSRFFLFSRCFSKFLYTFFFSRQQVFVTFLLLVWLWNDLKFIAFWFALTKPPILLSYSARGTCWTLKHFSRANIFAFKVSITKVCALLLHRSPMFNWWSKTIK